MVECECHVPPHRQSWRTVDVLRTPYSSRVCGVRRLRRGLAQATRREALGEFRRFAEAPTILHLADLVVLDPQNLIALLVGVGPSRAPYQPQHHRAPGRRYDLSART